MKFRVWDKLREAYIYHNPKKYQGHFVISLNGSFIDMHNGSGGDEYVVQMSTGVLDGNNQEIYDGDIVRNHNFGDPNIGRVYFCSGCFMIDGAGTMYDEVYSVNPQMAPDIEVIGNIFENKNLLDIEN